VLERHLLHVERLLLELVVSAGQVKQNVTDIESKLK
jgi:hypothetical protein